MQILKYFDANNAEMPRCKCIADARLCKCHDATAMMNAIMQMLSCKCHHARITMQILSYSGYHADAIHDATMNHRMLDFGVPQVQKNQW